MNSFADCYVAAPDGLRLYYRDYGGRRAPGTPVVCIPGLTRNSRDFAPIAAHLARTRRVIAVDLRGRGRSQYDSNPANYSVPVELNDVLALMAAAGVPQAVILGTSRGGIIAMAMAAARPDAIRAAILNDIGPELSRPGLERIMGYVGRTPALADWDAAVAALKAIAGDAFALDETQWLAHARAIFREENGRPVPDYDAAIGDALREAVRTAGAAPPDQWPLFEALKDKPTLVLRGANSDLLSAETLARMRAAKPDLATVEVAGRGHAPLLDEPESIDAIDRFLARID